MNDGKICVSICAANANEMLEKIRRAENSADVVEVRLDCVESKQIPKAFAFLSSIKKPKLLTYRPKEQGGKAEADLLQRKTFWNAFVFNGIGDANKFWIDYEYDLTDAKKISNSTTIRSFHDFSGVPENLEEIYEKLFVQADVGKIAVQADDVTDAIAVWKLLEKAKADNRRIIPIAMGDAGKWTRILGLSRGAFLTYGALDAKSETAPGQVSAQDLTEVYRVKELNEKTEIYGVIGGNTNYSMSPYLHNAAFKYHDLNAVFIPFQTLDLKEFMRRMVKSRTREVELNFKGFAVTIPHKQPMVEQLDFLDETARKIGAVNTVKIENDKFYGYNTDAAGFIEPLKTAYGDLKGARVAVFGAGGAARACVYSLKNENAEVVVFARDIRKAQPLVEEFKVQSSKFKVQGADYKDFDILINATPLGTVGKYENEIVAVAEQLKNVSLVYDLVYNPLETNLIKEARKARALTIGGLEMLVAQAARQQKIWTEKDAPVEEMRAAAFRKLQT